MTKQGRTFTPEFKRETACLVLDQSCSHTEAGRSLGLVESERGASATGYRSVPAAAIQLAATSSVQQRASACGR